MNDDMLRPATSTVPNSRLTCGQCDRMIQDAVDGTLIGDDQAQFDLHVDGCGECRRLYDEALDGLAFLAELKEAPPEPPSLLVNRILARTSGDPAVALPVRGSEPLLAGGGAAYPVGHLAAVLPFQQPVRRAWPARMVSAAMQPRFAMTAAMAFFSVALTMNLLGISPRDFHVSSLKPSSLRRDVRDVNNRIVRYYNGIRVVYELESRVNEMRQTDDESRPSKPATEPKQPDKAAPGSGDHSLLRRGRRSLSPEVLALLPLAQPLHATVSAAGNRGEGATV